MNNKAELIISTKNMKSNQNWELINLKTNQVYQIGPDQNIEFIGEDFQFMLKKVPELPQNFVLEQNYPNPFNPKTIISFGLPVSTELNISVYNLMGQKISTLISGYFSEGFHTVTWDGVSDDGFHVSSGVYLYTIETETFQDMKKMIFIQ